LTYNTIFVFNEVEYINVCTTTILSDICDENVAKDTSDQTQAQIVFSRIIKYITAILLRLNVVLICLNKLGEHSAPAHNPISGVVNVCP
jgi:hypothetical protein